MSFSSNVKEEISRIEESQPCCRKQELLALLRNGLSLRQLKGVPRLMFVSENAALSRHVFSAVKELYHSGPEVVMLKTHRFRDHAIYRLDFSALTAIPDAKGLLADCGIRVESDGLRYQNQRPKTRCCRRAFLRGCFLSTGSISDPDRSYHLEISFPTRELMETFRAVLREFGISAKEIVRKGHQLAYLKEGQEIVDFLNIVGAHNSLMQLENIRIMKDVRNQVNRIVNCETANLEKTVNASFRQVERIRYLNAHLGLDALPDGLREIARLRLENPEVSLQELGEMLSPALSKSGVNHRLRKLERLAEQAGGVSGDFYVPNG